MVAEMHSKDTGRPQRASKTTTAAIPIANKGMTVTKRPEMTTTKKADTATAKKGETAAKKTEMAAMKKADMVTAKKGEIAARKTETATKKSTATQSGTTAQAGGARTKSAPTPADKKTPTAPAVLKKARGTAAPCGGKKCVACFFFLVSQMLKTFFLWLGRPLCDICRRTPRPRLSGPRPRICGMFFYSFFH